MTRSMAGRAANLPTSSGHGCPASSALVDSAPVAMIATDLDRRVLAWNRLAESLFGWRAGEVLEARIPTIPERVRHGAAVLCAAAAG